MNGGYTDDEIEEMLDRCLDKLEGDPLAFIRSLLNSYERRMFLIDGQANALAKFYNNLNRYRD